MTALADNYIGNSPLYCGRDAPPSGDPAWMATAGVALNKAVVIPDVAGGGGATMSAWGSVAVRQTTGEIFTACQAGHTDGPYNGVTKLNLMADGPAWVTCSAATPSGQLIQDSTDWNADGKPVARHSYDHLQWCPITDKLIMIGGFGFWLNGGSTNASDAFDPVTNTWSAHNAYEFIAGIGYGTCIDTTRGHIWTNGLRRFNTTTKLYMSATIGSQTVNVRYPMKYDSLRDQMFTLMWGDGGPDPATTPLNASKIPVTGTTQTPITFNASAAYTQFVSDAPYGLYAGMDYDPVNDVFYWYSGTGVSRGRLYVIHPNNTSVWDMTLFSFASGSATLDATVNAGTNGRLKYVNSLKGFVLNPSANGNWFFIKTSN